MYAIIKTGGKQYKVKQGETIDVELLGCEPDAKIEFPEVLFFSDGSAQQVGAPHVKGVIVAGKFISQVSGPKISSVKYLPSHNVRKKFGHRQKYSRVEITEISSEKKEHHHKEAHHKKES